MLFCILHFYSLQLSAILGFGDTIYPMNIQHGLYKYQKLEKQLFLPLLAITENITSDQRAKSVCYDEF